MQDNINDKQLMAAYALNLWTVSVSQIIDYNDTNVLQQEYDTIMNNLNLEKMPKDETLLDVIKQVMDEIKSIQIDEGDKKFVEKEYQHQLKNAVWSAVPNVAAIFATANPAVMGVTLATQVGIGYMNYRRNKSQYELAYEKSKWEIQKNRMQHLNGLMQQLFETSWRMADKYEFRDEYRLTAKQISDYNKALMENNPVKRYNNLNIMRGVFNAYPAFWYQLGSTANSIYRSSLYDADLDIKNAYKARAIEAFEEYSKLNRFNLLRNDLITSAWALEYFELLDLNSENEPDKAYVLISNAEKYSGNALDVSELCAFAYLRIGDENNAMRLFHYLVNSDYNSEINTQILSGLYIKRMRSSDIAIASEAERDYRELKNITNPRFILPIPNESVDIKGWKPEWNREESFDDFIEKTKKEETEKKEESEEKRKKARLFYQQPHIIVYNSGYENIAEYFLGILNENRSQIDDRLPAPSRMHIKEYKKNRVELEQKGVHIIMLGDSDEAKSFYKNTKNGRWDYYNLGMRFMSYGNKTVILIRPLKNRDIDALIKLAREVNKRHKVKIPSDVATVTGFFEEMFSSVTSDTVDVIAAIIASIIGSPLLVVGAGLKGIINVTQTVQNSFSMKDLGFLRYSIAIYEYLDRQDAILS